MIVFVFIIAYAMQGTAQRLAAQLLGRFRLVVTILAGK
jgi:hypothetical protein